jgi:hypothetical protein
VAHSARFAAGLLRNDAIESTPRLLNHACGSAGVFVCMRAARNTAASNLESRGFAVAIVVGFEDCVDDIPESRSDPANAYSV